MRVCACVCVCVCVSYSQDDGKLVKRLEMRTTGEERTPVTAANMRYMMCEGPIMAAVSHSEELGPGTDPVVQLVSGHTHTHSHTDRHTQKTPLRLFIVRKQA